MSTATLRIPEEKRDLLKIIASVERHRETLELLSRPEWVEEIRKGKDEVTRGVNVSSSSTRRPAVASVKRSGSSSGWLACAVHA